MNKTTLTVGMPNYNHAQFLRVALDAILAQSRQPDELIVIDDASTDGSVEILRDYQQRHPQLRVIFNERNLGVVANLERLLAMAQGRYFYAPAADDIILPGFLEKSMALLESNPSAGLCSTLCYTTDAKGKKRELLYASPFCGPQANYHLSPAQVRHYYETRTPWMQGNTVVYRKDALRAAGGYRPELGSYSDGFAVSVIALTHGACFIREPLAVWRIMPTSFSAGTSVNARTNRKNYDTARACIVGEYKDIFPESYLGRWANRWHSGFLLSYTCAKRREWLDGLKHALVSDKGHRRLLLAIATAVTAVGLGLAVLAAVSLRWFDVRDMIGNRVNRWWHRNFIKKNGASFESRASQQ